MEGDLTIVTQRHRPFKVGEASTAGSGVADGRDFGNCPARRQKDRLGTAATIDPAPESDLAIVVQDQAQTEGIERSANRG